MKDSYGRKVRKIVTHQFLLILCERWDYSIKFSLFSVWLFIDLCPTPNLLFSYLFYNYFVFTFVHTFSVFPTVLEITYLPSDSPVFSLFFSVVPFHLLYLFLYFRILDTIQTLCSCSSYTDFVLMTPLHHSRPLLWNPLSKLIVIIRILFYTSCLCFSF